MALIRIRRRIKPKRPKMSKLEFEIIKPILENLDIDFESDNTLTFNYSTVYCGSRPIAFPEKYRYLKEIHREQVIINPLKSEKHANIIIDMFEELNPTCVIEISINDDNTYSGMIKNLKENTTLSNVEGVPTIPSLKTLLVAGAILYPSTFAELYDTFLDYVKSEVR